MLGFELRASCLLLGKGNDHELVLDIITAEALSKLQQACDHNPETQHIDLIMLSLLTPPSFCCLLPPCPLSDYSASNFLFSHYHGILAQTLQLPCFSLFLLASHLSVAVYSASPVATMNSHMHT
jgi:hypothetical protein